MEPDAFDMMAKGLDASLIAEAWVPGDSDFADGLPLRHVLQRDARLLKDLTVKEIAELYNANVITVQLYLQQLKIPFVRKANRWLDVDWKKSNAEIAKEMNVNPSSVGVQRKTRGLSHDPLTHTMRAGRVSLPDWATVDWRTPTRVLAQELGLPMSMISSKRRIYAPQTLRTMRSSIRSVLPPPPEEDFAI
jgi:hypothetical protein